ASDQVRHEKYRTEHICPADSFCQEQCHRKGKHIDQDHRNDRKQSRIPQRMDKLCIPQYFQIISDPDKFRIRYCCEITKRKVDSKNKRGQKSDRKGDHRREYKYRKIFFYSFLHFSLSFLQRAPSETAGALFSLL